MVKQMKRTRTETGDGSFAVAAASLWNHLPTVAFTGGHGFVVVCMLVLLAYLSTLNSAVWKGQAI